MDDHNITVGEFKFFPGFTGGRNYDWDGLHIECHNNYFKKIRTPSFSCKQMGIVYTGMSSTYIRENLKLKPWTCLKCRKEVPKQVRIMAMLMDLARRGE